MATLTFELKKPKKDGSVGINILLTHNRKLKRIPTGIFLSKGDFRNGKIRNREISDKVDEILWDFRHKLNKIPFQENLTVEEISEILTKRETLDFIEAYREFLTENKDIKGLKNYKVALNSLVKFAGEHVYFAEISTDFLTRYSLWFGDKKRALTLYLGALRHVFNWAMEKYNREEYGIVKIPYNPFTRFKIPRQEMPQKRALTVEQIRGIIAFKPTTEREALARDVFLLSFGLMGMNAADLYTATEFSGNIIRYNRAKTKDRRKDQAYIEVTIQDEITPLFLKYRGENRVFRFYENYSRLDSFNNALNHGLKPIGKAIGVDRLQFYAARHSWATIARNDLRIGKDVINDALNHVGDYRVTDIYIKKDFSEINEANKKVLEYVFKP